MYALSEFLIDEHPLPTMRLYCYYYNMLSLILHCFCAQGKYSSLMKQFLYFQAKAFVADPSAFAALNPVAQEETKEDKPAAAAKEESEEESDDDMGFGLFD